jgi:hypothetical protein
MSLSAISSIPGAYQDQAEDQGKTGVNRGFADMIVRRASDHHRVRRALAGRVKTRGLPSPQDSIPSADHAQQRETT